MFRLGWSSNPKMLMNGARTQSCGEIQPVSPPTPPPFPLIRQLISPFSILIINKRASEVKICCKTSTRFGYGVRNIFWFYGIKENLTGVVKNAPHRMNNTLKQYWNGLTARSWTLWNLLIFSFYALPAAKSITSSAPWTVYNDFFSPISRRYDFIRHKMDFNSNNR